MDYQDEDISLPSNQNTEDLFSGLYDAANRHRVKRGGAYGGVGKTASKLGLKFKKLCLVPGYGTALCPLIKPVGKLYIKIGVGAKKFGKSLKKKAPKLPSKTLKRAKTANPVTATKMAIKNAPIAVKSLKKLG